MTTALIYVFLFSTWGLGLLTWLLALGHFATSWGLSREEKTLEISQKKLFFSKFSSLTGVKPSVSGTMIATPDPTKDVIPEKIRELMKSSPNHPEVEEIDSSDEILGVRFEAENYPPGFGDEEE